jgi:uncharacterized repeat protein (TIGR03803 family)
MIGRSLVVVMFVCVAGMFAGCGGSQLPIGGVPSTMPQSRGSIEYKSLYSFGKGSDGKEPMAALIDANGTLYGTTFAGGRMGCVGGCGTVFKIGSSGKETVLYRFGGGTDGANPSASLLAVRGVLYGTTEFGGGEDDFGTVFKLSTTGVEKVLHSFQGYQGHSNYDGAHPVASLINVNGTLYSTTSNGGDSVCFGDGCGTVYSINRKGSERVLHSFADYSDGSIPVAGLIDVKGTMYGTTQLGAATSSEGNGTVFSVGTTGKESVLYNFPYAGSEGAGPSASLININGTLYGTTGYDGVYDGGTAFSITTSGSLTNLQSFGSDSDGNRPLAPLVNVRGTLYGTTSLGGAYGRGTVFRMSLSGTDEKVVHSFGHGSDGATPLASLIDVKGTLYGTTSVGGKNGKGTVFALTP